MTNTKETMEERFDNLMYNKEQSLEGFFWDDKTRLIVKEFVNQELTSLIVEILEKNSWSTIAGEKYVKVEDIKQICKEWGIEI